jgi:hypothetical protein
MRGNCDACALWSILMKSCKWCARRVVCCMFCRAENPCLRALILIWPTGAWNDAVCAAGWRSRHHHHTQHAEQTKPCAECDAVISIQHTSRTKAVPMRILPWHRNIYIYYVYSKPYGHHIHTCARHKLNLN